MVELLLVKLLQKLLGAKLSLLELLLVKLLQSLLMVCWLPVWYEMFGLSPTRGDSVFVFWFLVLIWIKKNVGAGRDTHELMWHSPE